jgi:hypothetical protein
LQLVEHGHIVRDLFTIVNIGTNPKFLWVVVGGLLAVKTGVIAYGKGPLNQGFRVFVGNVGYQFTKLKDFYYVVL